MLNIVKTRCWITNVFTNSSDRHQPAEIIESDLWALGANRKVHSRESPTPSFCVTERNKTNSAQVCDIFIIFMFLSPFVTLSAMKPKMLQKATEEGKTRDFSVL